MQQGYPQLQMMDCDSFVGIAPPTPPEWMSVVTLYPNPVSDEFWVEINLPETEKISVELYNIMGKQVKRLFDGEIKKGESFMNFNSTGLSNGVYLVVVKGETFSRVLRMVKTESH